MDTFGLSSANWDLYVDGNNNLAIVSDANQIVQDVASAIQTYLGEVYYDATIGVPYFDKILAKPYAPALITPYLEAAALTVPGVVKAKATITGFVNRQISGNVQIIDATGAALGVNF